jgi:hypothetical protein
MSLWEFYKQLVQKAREADPEFPLFDHEDFVEKLLETAERLWQELRPFVSPSPPRYEEHWEQLTQRDRYWHWFCKTLWYASYGSGQPVFSKEIFALSKYDSTLEGVGAPVPVAGEILGGPALVIRFSDDEVLRMQRSYEAGEMSI